VKRTRAREAWLIVLVGLAAAVAGYAYYLYRSPTPPPTDPAAIGELMKARFSDLQGNTASIDQWRGNVLVINFWATWCEPCREEIPLFIRLQKKYGDRGLKFVGIALDRPEAVKPYAAEMGMNFPVLIGGPDAIDLARRTGNRSAVLPYTIVIDSKGRVAMAEIGVVKESRVEPLLASLLSAAAK
jgi:thiol-disulfide isomerase/thioredoxin